MVRDAVVLRVLTRSAIMIFVGATVFFASDPLSRGLNALSASLYTNFPTLKRLSGSGNAGTELNYRALLVCFRICGGILLAGGIVLVLMVFLARFYSPRSQ